MNKEDSTQKSKPQMLLSYDHLLYIITFIVFTVPNNSSFLIDVGFGKFPLNHIFFMILPFVNKLCTKTNMHLRVDAITKNLILLLFFAVLVNEFVLKMIVYDVTIYESTKSIQVAIPFFSVMILIYQGLNVNAVNLLKVVLTASFISSALSAISIYANIGFYDNDAMISAGEFRFANSNSSLGVVAIFLLVTDKFAVMTSKWKYISLISIVTLVLGFNRIYIVTLIPILGIYIYISGNKRIASMTAVFLVLICIMLTFLYKSSDAVSYQIDNRFFDFIDGESSITDPGSIGGRSFIYSQIAERFDEGHWIMGLPYSKPIFIMNDVYGDEYRASSTDMSIVNILLRYGTFSLMIIAIIFYRLFFEKQSGFLRCVAITYLLASLNSDTLLQQNSIFFLIVALYISRHVIAIRNSGREVIL